MGDHDMSTINGKPVDALAKLAIHFDFKEWKAPVEKVFGVVLKESNVVLKFNSILLDYPYGNHETKRKGQRKIQYKLIYLSEDPIDCKIQRNNENPEFSQNVTSGNQVFVTVFRYTTNPISGQSWSKQKITISLSLKMTRQDFPLLTQISSSFNAEMSSDFVVECRGKEFYVHQYILRERSGYFAGMLQNNCMESKNRRIVINDFDPQVVEILLRYLYNGAVGWHAMKLSGKIMIGVIKIADKYNFTALIDAMDSYIAQRYLCILNISEKPEQLATLKKAIKVVDKTLLPKLTTLIFLWKNSDESEISDEQWSKLIRDYPGFAQLMANIACRKDYEEWGRQHRTWFLALEQTDNNQYPTIGSDSAIIVGPLGEMKGAFKCSSIL